MFELSTLFVFGSDIHPQKAISEVQHALGFVCDKLGRDLVEAVATFSDDAGV